MTDSGVDSEPSPSSPDSDARSASPRLISLLRRSASPSGMTLLRRSASPSGMTLLRRSASPAACAVIRRSEPTAAATAAILLNTWHSADGSAAAATSATEEDDDDEEEEEEEKITLYRSEEDCEHPSSILRLESATSSTVRLENPSSAPSVSLENPSSSSSSSCSQLESLETVEEKMETVEALLSLSDSSRSPLASPEKQSGQPPGTGKNKELRKRNPIWSFCLCIYHTSSAAIFKGDVDDVLVVLTTYILGGNIAIDFNVKFGPIPFMQRFCCCRIWLQPYPFSLYQPHNTSVNCSKYSRIECFTRRVI
jgi:hypothetical protein